MSDIISRRKALLRLGALASVAYATPVLMTITKAQASKGGGGGGGTAAVAAMVQVVATVVVDLLTAGPPMAHRLTLLTTMMMHPMPHPHATKLRSALNSISEKKGPKIPVPFFIPLVIISA